MSWPYITKIVVNAGTLEEPDFKEMPKLIWIPGKGRGPYEQCGDCRLKKAGNPKMKVGFSIMGARRCAPHILRYHRDNGTLTDELKEDVLHRDEVHKRLRAGHYYKEK